MQPPHPERLERALLSLEGLSVADALGGFFEFGRPLVLQWACASRKLPACTWHWTDDTAMALSIVAGLREHGAIDQDWLAADFAARYERWRGYGPATRAMLKRIRQGEDWRAASQSLFGGTGSYGNGGAMRIAPLGAYFADDPAALVEQAHLATVITHAHPEAVAGAIAVALAAGQAVQRPADPPAAFLDAVIADVPASLVRDGLISARDLPRTTPIAAVVAALGNGRNVSAQDTVPFALWCAAQHLRSFEEMIWLTLSGGGDCDTTCAIAGGVVALSAGVASIPAAWRASREPLPDLNRAENP
jgi:ADP-ribosylglycohydrolase